MSVGTYHAKHLPKYATLPLFRWNLNQKVAIEEDKLGNIYANDSYSRFLKSIWSIESKMQLTLTGKAFKFTLSLIL